MMRWQPVVSLCCIALALATDQGVGPISLGEDVQSTEHSREAAGGCKLSAWGGAGDCSLQCGGGLRTWRRAVISAPKGAKCPPLLRTTPCNTHACAGARAEDKAGAAPAVLKKSDQEYQRRKVAARKEALAALTKTLGVVKEGKAGESPLNSPEFKDLLDRTEEELYVREAHAKAHLKQKQHQEAKQTEGPGIEPPVRKAATKFVHSYLYEDKLAAGEQQLQEAKEVTAKVQKDVAAKAKTKTKQTGAPPSKDRYKSEMKHGDNAYKGGDFRKARKHFREARKPDLGESSEDGPAQLDYDLARKMLNDKLEAIHERRIKITGQPDGQVTSVKQQIDQAVAQAYKRANEQSAKKSKAAIQEVRGEAKRQLHKMKSEMRTQIEDDQVKMAQENAKVKSLFKKSEDIASRTEANVNKVIQARAKKVEDKKIHAVEAALVAQQAIKHVKIQLAAAKKGAYFAGVAAARLLKRGGSAHGQKLADDKAHAMAKRVDMYKNQLKMTQRLVGVSAEGGAPATSVKATEKKTKQQVLKDVTKAKLMEDKCSEAKSQLKRACAAIEMEQEKEEKQGIAELKKQERKEAATQKSGNQTAVLVLLEKDEELDLERKMAAIKQQGAAAGKKQQQLEKAAQDQEKCDKARKKESKWCGMARKREAAAHKAKVKAAGDIAAAAKYKAARVAGDEAKGSATRNELLAADERAEALKKKFEKLKAVKFEPTQAAQPAFLPNQKKVLQEMITAGVAAAMSKGQGGTMVSLSPKATKKKAEAEKILKKQGKAMMKEKEAGAKLADFTKDSAKAKKEMEQAVKDAKAAAEKAADPDQKKKAEARVADLKAKQTDQRLEEQAAIKKMKTTLEADKAKTKELAKQEKMAKQTESAMARASATRAQAQKAENTVAKSAAKQKKAAYHAAMEAAKVAAKEASAMASRAEVAAADTAADAAAKSSEEAINAATDVFKCNSGRAKIADIKTKMITASVAAKAQFSKQLKNLRKKTDAACARSKKSKKTAAQAATTAKSEEKIAKKEMKKEKKVADPNSTFDPANPLIKKDWKVVRQGNVLTASVSGVFNETAVVESERAKSAAVSQLEDALLEIN